MKLNYKNHDGCPNCKLVVWGKSWEWPELFCNQDNKYDAEKLYDWLWEDDKIELLWEYEDTHSVHINGICDEYEKEEDDE